MLYAPFILMPTGDHYPFPLLNTACRTTCTRLAAGSATPTCNIQRVAHLLNIYNNRALQIVRPVSPYLPPSTAENQTHYTLLNHVLPGAALAGAIANHASRLSSTMAPPEQFASLSELNFTGHVSKSYTHVGHRFCARPWASKYVQFFPSQTDTCFNLMTINGRLGVRIVHTLTINLLSNMLTSMCTI